MLQTYRANGKLLITSEYFVLDNTPALALPTRFGQHMQVEDQEVLSDLQVTSLDVEGNPWFTASYSLPGLALLSASDDLIGDRFHQILLAARSLNPQFLDTVEGKVLQNRLEFPRNWGLGTSSTLISNIARWAGVDPFQLLEKTFGGSGYDIACAQAKGPILYQRKDETVYFEEIEFQPPFSADLYFVFLNKKQNSREGISRYRSSQFDKVEISEALTILTTKIRGARLLGEFEGLLEQHEDIISKALDLDKAKDLYFEDYWGAVKSLGAWGGDFVMVTSDRSFEETRGYFEGKGYSTFLRYSGVII